MYPSPDRRLYEILMKGPASAHPLPKDAKVSSQELPFTSKTFRIMHKLGRKEENMTSLPPCPSAVATFLTDPDAATKEITALANTLGGVLYIGVDRSGTVTGVDDPHRLEEQMLERLRAIFPPVLPLLSFGRLRVDGKTVLTLHVASGPHKPYFADPGNIRTAFVRAGAHTLPATDAQIRRFLEEASPTPWEERTAVEQTLTFSDCCACAGERGLFLNPSEDVRFRLKDMRSGCFTRLALLLSDQNPFRIKVSVFRDNEKSVLTRTKTFTGSILLSLRDAYRFLQYECLLLMEKPEDGRLERTDYYAVPPAALLEALVALVVHRDYQTTEPFVIHVTPSEVLFFAAGGPGAWTDEMLRLRIAPECRNPRLLALLQTLRLADETGFGLHTVAEVYSYEPLSRRLLLFPTNFALSLPRRTLSELRGEAKSPSLTSAVRSVDERVRTLLRAKGKVSRSDVEEALGLPRSTANYHLRKLLEAGRIRKIGAGKTSLYMLDE